VSKYQKLIDDIQFHLAAEDQTLTSEIEAAAGEFAELTKLINQRLRQCDALLQKGLRAEALQLAEQDPKVLELSQLVASVDRPMWDQLVSLYGLPRAEPLLMGVAETLGEAYWQQQPLTQLLSLHRLLAIGRASLRDRLSVMRRLQSADSTNPIWEQDVREFEKARLAEIEQEARHAKDLQSLQELLTELNGVEWCSPPSAASIKIVNSRLGQVQRQQARVELEQLKPKIDDAFSALDQPGLRNLKKLWLTQMKLAGLPPNDPLAEHVAPAFGWLSDEESRHVTGTAWNAAVGALETALRDSQSSHEELSRLSMAIAATGRPAPPVLASRTRLRIEQLQVNAIKRNRSMIGLAAAGGLFVVAIGAGIAWRQVQWASVTAAVAQADEQIDRLEFDNARRLLQQQTAYASTDLLVDALQRLSDAERAEQIRRENFRTTCRQISDAPTFALASGLLKSLAGMAKLTEDQREVDRLTALWDEKQRLDAATRDQRLESLLRPVEASLDALQGLDGLRLTASEAVASLAQARNALHGVESAVDKGASDELKKRRDVALSRWTTLKQLQDVQLKRNESLSELTTNSLIEPGKADPVVRLTAYEAAMQRFANAFPSDPRSVEFRQPSDKLAAQDVLRFGLLKSNWAQTSLSSVSAIRRQIGEIEAYLQASLRLPVHDLANEYKTLLERRLGQQATLQGGEGGLRDDIVAIFNREVMSGLHILKVQPDNGDVRLYYLGAAAQFSSAKPVSFEYLTNYRRKPQKSLGIQYKDLVAGVTQEAPHIAIAKSIRTKFATVGFSDWRSVCLQTLEELWNNTTIDPLFRFLLMQQVAEAAGSGDIHLQAALKPLTTILFDKSVDPGADWMDPDNSNANTQRKRVVELVERANSLGLADFDAITKTAAAADRNFQARLTQKLLCVGWLTRSAKGTGWECRSQWQPEGSCQLLVLVPETEASYRWQPLGRVTAAGWEITATAELEGLREGKLVFAEAIGSPAANTIGTSTP